MKSRDDKIRLMLQNLLADRFKLVVRRDTRVSPVYAVAVAKLGPRLKKSGIEEKDYPEVANRCDIRHRRQVLLSPTATLLMAMSKVGVHSRGDCVGSGICLSAHT